MHRFYSWIYCSAPSWRCAIFPAVGHSEVGYVGNVAIACFSTQISISQRATSTQLAASLQVLRSPPGWMALLQTPRPSRCAPSRCARLHSTSSVRHITAVHRHHAPKLWPGQPPTKAEHCGASVVQVDCMRRCCCAQPCSSMACCWCTTFTLMQALGCCSSVVKALHKLAVRQCTLAEGRCRLGLLPPLAPPLQLESAAATATHLPAGVCTWAI
jgi:hypothetical protein